MDCLAHNDERRTSCDWGAESKPCDQPKPDWMFIHKHHEWAGVGNFSRENERSALIPRQIAEEHCFRSGRGVWVFGHFNELRWFVLLLLKCKKRINIIQL